MNSETNQAMLDTLNGNLVNAIKLIPESSTQLNRVDFSTLLANLEQALDVAKELERSK